MGIDSAAKYKSQARDYMATFLDDPGRFFPDFRQFAVMASRKLGLEPVMDLAWCNHQVVGYGNCLKTLSV
jgi:hypothetical protein